MRKLQILLGLVLFGGMVTSLSAQAAERSWALDGQSLKIDTPCAKNVTIQPGAAAGKIKIQAEADHGEEIAQLSVTGGTVAKIGKNQDGCWSNHNISIGGVRIGGSSNPTLMLTLTVPDGISIEIREHGSADYQLGAVGGPLALDLGGSGDVSAATVTDLSLKISGSGNAEIADLTGRLIGVMSGSGNLTVTRAVVSQSNLAQSGSGNVSADHFQGPLQVKMSGSGNLNIGMIDSANVALQLSGSSDITINEGKITNLALSASGSSDVTIDAAIRDASINLAGSSEVHIPEVSGHLAQSNSGSSHIEIAGH